MLVKLDINNCEDFKMVLDSNFTVTIMHESNIGKDAITELNSIEGCCVKLSVSEEVFKYVCYLEEDNEDKDAVNFAAMCYLGQRMDESASCRELINIDEFFNDLSSGGFKTFVIVDDKYVKQTETE